jgi:hypothetical protein
VRADRLEPHGRRERGPSIEFGLQRELRWSPVVERGNLVDRWRVEGAPVLTDRFSADRQLQLGYVVEGHWSPRAPSSGLTVLPQNRGREPQQRGSSTDAALVPSPGERVVSCAERWGRFRWWPWGSGVSGELLVEKDWSVTALSGGAPKLRRCAWQPEG